MHLNLTTAYGGPEWYGILKLEHDQLSMLNKAKQLLVKEKKLLEPSRLVAELPFDGTSGEIPHPRKKLTEDQKARSSEINSLYGAKIAEKETFLQGEIVKSKMKGDATGVAELQDQLGREVRRLHSEWEEKKAAVHSEKP